MFMFQWLNSQVTGDNLNAKTLALLLSGHFSGQSIIPSQFCYDITTVKTATDGNIRT